MQPCRVFLLGASICDARDVLVRVAFWLFSSSARPCRVTVAFSGFCMVSRGLEFRAHSCFVGSGVNRAFSMMSFTALEPP